MSDYLNQQHLIAMEDSEERWLERLKDIRDKYHLYNCTTLNKQRTAFALSNTYDHRVCEIEEIISMELNDNSRTA
ncbi:MAG: hypothetical protein HRT61_18625 [Ekhidna sp.]|nr:hypothetical protein [Ekhidna sp.]